jgi:hypothetical protein
MGWPLWLGALLWLFCLVALGAAILAPLYVDGQWIDVGRVSIGAGRGLIGILDAPPGIYHGTDGSTQLWSLKVGDWSWTVWKRGR